MIIYNNKYPALFNQKDAEEFLDGVKKLVNKALNNMNRGKINYRSFTQEKYNKLLLAIESDSFDYKKLNDIVGIGYNANFSFVKLEEVANDIEKNKSFSKSNNELMKDICKDLNASLIRDDSDLSFTDTINSSEIKKMIKMNSDRVNLVLTKIFNFNKRTLDYVIKPDNDKISIDDMNNFIDLFMDENHISKYIEKDLIIGDTDNIDDNEFGFKISFNSCPLEEQLRIIDAIDKFYKEYTTNKNNENYVAISYDKEPLERLFDYYY